MIKQQKLEDLILESINLRPTSTGWYTCKCVLCHDYKDRGGFKFDGGAVGYSCFNCGKTGKYEEYSGEMSKSMRRILNAFGVDDSSISSVVNSAFFNKKEETGKITLGALQKVNTATPPVKLPLKSFKLGETDEGLDLQERIVDYLVNRCIDFDKYQFFFSLDPRMKDRVIVPFYRNGNLIYWQARSIDPNEKKRYDNAIVSRDAVIFNFDQLQSYSPTPLLVCEGIFDAMMFNGIAVLGSKLSEAKVELLAKTNRRLVFVIDKDKNGASFADSVIRAGWDITFAPDGAADLNKSVQRFGRSWTARQLIKNIPADEASARLAIAFNCK